MKNKKITRKITQGMYILTTSGGGCVVDAVSQVSASDNPFIAVSVMKSNYTNKLMHENDLFALSVIGMDSDPSLIKTFGFQSMRDVDKFQGVNVDTINGVKVIKDALGYMLCEKVDSIENETHTLFIGKLVDGDIYQDKEAMSYQYYQEHKEELLKVKTLEGKTAWVCTMCGYVYYGEVLPDDFVCPLCGVSKDYFEVKK